MIPIDYYGGLRVTIQTSDIDDYPILVLHELANLYSTDEFLDMWEKNRNDLTRDLNHTCSQKVNVEQTQPDDSFISKILDKINRDVVDGPIVWWILHSPVGHDLKPHVDRKDATIIIPIFPNDYTLNFYKTKDDIDPILSYKHTNTPISVKGKSVPHGTEDINQDRIWICIEFSCKKTTSNAWDDFKTCYENGTLFV
jgi:hypothetical protein